MRSTPGPAPHDRWPRNGRRRLQSRLPRRRWPPGRHRPRTVAAPAAGAAWPRRRRWAAWRPGLGAAGGQGTGSRRCLLAWQVSWHGIQRRELGHAGARLARRRRCCSAPSGRPGESCTCRSLTRPRLPRKLRLRDLSSPNSSRSCTGGGGHGVVTGWSWGGHGGRAGRMWPASTDDAGRPQGHAGTECVSPAPCSISAAHRLELVLSWHAGSAGSKVHRLPAISTGAGGRAGGIGKRSHGTVAARAVPGRLAGRRPAGPEPSWQPACTQPETRLLCAPSAGQRQACNM